MTRMTRALAVAATAAGLVALSAAAQAQEAVGRYQAVTVPRGNGDASLVLVDTATGRTWILGSAESTAGRKEPRWQALRFLLPTAGPAQDGDPLYPNATPPDEAARRSGVLRGQRPTN